LFNDASCRWPEKTRQVDSPNVRASKHQSLGALTENLSIYIDPSHNTWQHKGVMHVVFSTNTHVRYLLKAARSILVPVYLCFSVALSGGENSRSNFRLNTRITPNPSAEKIQHSNLKYLQIR
jgi:hypothetical protein